MQMRYNTGMTTTTNPAPATSDNSLAITSMILGIVSLTGPGLLLGIPAIITGAIALRRNGTNRGMSLTGLITGIVSTVFSILFIGFFLFMMMVGILGDSGYYDTPSYDHSGDSSHYESLHT